MKVAVIGSRGLSEIDFEKYLPKHVTEIVTGGAAGIDTRAQEYARDKSIPVKLFLPQYEKFGKSAPLKRNVEIIEYSDKVIAFWDGKSRGTKFVIDECKKRGKPIKVITKRT